MLKPTRVAKLLNGNLGSNREVLEVMNPNTLIYFSTNPPSKYIDEYTIEELENILANAKHEKLRHEAHVLRTRNVELYDYIIADWIYSQNDAGDE
jgi:hypothetical protein